MTTREMEIKTLGFGLGQLDQSIKQFWDNFYEEAIKIEDEQRGNAPAYSIFRDWSIKASEILNGTVADVLDYWEDRFEAQNMPKEFVEEFHETGNSEWKRIWNKIEELERDNEERLDREFEKEA